MADSTDPRAPAGAPSPAQPAASVPAHPVAPAQAGAQLPPVARKAQTAVALAYGDGDLAPKVVAKGKGLVAEQIIRKAREADVFVHESRELVSLLMDIDLDQHIPPALYRVVAELLAWLYHIESAQQSGGVMPAPPDAAQLIEPSNAAGTDATT